MRFGVIREEPSLFLTGLVLGLLGLCILAWIVVFTTLRPPVLIFGQAGWVGNFSPLHETSGELPPIYKFESETKLWRNWQPGALEPWKGEMWSVPFPSIGVIGLPVQGFTERLSGNHVVLECLADGRQQQFAHLSTYYKWTFVVADARNFCGGSVRIGAIAESNKLLGVGTPVDVSRIEAFATRYLVPLTGLILPLVLVTAIWLAVTLVGGRRACQPAPSSIGLVATGIAAVLAFSGFSISPAVGRVTVAIMLLSACSVITISAVRRGLRNQMADLATPFAVWAVSGIAIVALGAAVDNGGGVWAVNTLFTPVEFSTDNQLPSGVANALAAGVPASQITFGSWLASDRTPLLSGYLLVLYGLLGPNALPDLHYLLGVAQQASGAMIMALWAPLTWLGLRFSRLNEKIIAAIVVVLGFTGFCIFNGLYLSPKLLSGGFGLLMVLTLACLPDFDSSGHTGGLLLSIAAVSGALALLSHSGALFGVAAALLVCMRPIVRQGIIRIMVAAALGALTLLPWIIWQTFVQPHGNALLRFFLVGHFGFESREASIFSEVIRAYSSLSFDQILFMKWTALRTMFGFPTSYCNNLQAFGKLWTTAPLETLMINETYYLPFAVAIPVLFGLLARWHSGISPGRIVRTLTLTGILAVASSLLVSWDSSCQIIYHFPFPTVFSLMIAGWITIFSSNVGARWIALFSIGLGFTTWVIVPLSNALTMRWAWLSVLVVSVVAALAFLGHALRSAFLPKRAIVQGTVGA